MIQHGKRSHSSGLGVGRRMHHEEEKGGLLVLLLSHPPPLFGTIVGTVVTTVSLEKKVAIQELVPFI